MYCKIKILLFALVLSCGMIGCQDKSADDKNVQESEKHVENKSQKAEGVYITYQIVSDGEIDAEIINDTVNKLQKRAEQYSSKAVVYQDGENCIRVEIPGVFDAESISQELGRTGELYFISETAENGSMNYSCTNSIWNLEKTIEELEEEGSIKLNGDDIKDAQVQVYQDFMGIGNDVVEIFLTDEGSEKFEEATMYAYKLGETIAIYYDGEFVSVPRVSAVISNGSVIIEGLTSFEEAENLASTIRIGNLKCELKVIDVEVIEDK